MSHINEQGFLNEELSHRGPNRIMQAHGLSAATQSQLKRVFAIGEQIYAADVHLMGAEQQFKKAERAQILGLSSQISDKSRKVASDYHQRHLRHTEGLLNAVKETRKSWSADDMRILSDAFADPQITGRIWDQMSTDLNEELLNDTELTLQEVADLWKLFNDRKQAVGNSFDQVWDSAESAIDSVLAIRNQPDRGCRLSPSYPGTSGYHAFEFNVKVIWEFIKGAVCFVLIYCWFVDSPGRWVKRLVREYRGCRWVEVRAIS